MPKLPTILDFFSGLFVGVGIGGAVLVFYLVYALTGLMFLSALAGLLVGCVFVFFSLVAKSLSILLKKSI
ncbi:MULTISPECIES: hypothetical protein [Helicobacter]|uniref:Uncharacterized protein n=2 Tax=Helicobacter TaxID=209 RepID=A0A377J5X4_9HELI|nr:MULTISPECIES: hypothetical protein [Helicobacter]MDL0079953.1 hypothetical protein [Helicobacter sp. CPD2-1]MDL0081741.1 hypothetical protein [Helicobacter sp. XJK30-2]STO97860.1 Uncharacterised protein [Helicobacter canis]